MTHHISIRDAAKQLGISPRALLRSLRRDTVPILAASRRLLLVAVADLEAWKIDHGQIAPAKPKKVNVFLSDEERKRRPA